MKILFVHKHILGCSGEAAMHYFPASLARLGHECSMVAMAGGDRGPLEAGGVAVYEVGPGEAWRGAVRRLVESKRPDIVHVFLYSGCGLLPLRIRPVSPAVRFVLDIRSPLLRTGPVRWLHRLKNVFEPMGFDAIASHGIESGRTQVGSRCRLHWLPPGVDFSLLPEAAGIAPKAGVHREGRRLVYIGSLDAIRKVDVMLGAVMDVVRRCDGVSLDLYGEGSQRRELEKQVSGQGLSERIRFMGSMDRRALLALLPDYDAGLAYIPDGIYDTAPALKTLEYLASGLPVLATDTLGNRMFVEHGKNGFLAGVDREAYAAGIYELIRHERLAEMSACARASVQAFDWLRIARERLLPLYQSLTGTGA